MPPSPNGQAIPRLHHDEPQGRHPLYIGVSGDFLDRVGQHRTGAISGFTKKYNLSRLVYYEFYDDPENAILREKRLKKWQRAWKVDLIEDMNPTWDDLYPKLIA